MFREIFKTMTNDVKRIKIPAIRDKIVTIVAVISFVVGAISSFFSVIGIFVLISMADDVNTDRIYKCIVIAIVSWFILWMTSAYERVRNGTNF